MTNKRVTVGNLRKVREELGRTITWEFLDGSRLSNDDAVEVGPEGEISSVAKGKWILHLNTVAGRPGEWWREWLRSKGYLPE